MSVTSKAKSAIGHLGAALLGVEKAKIHLLQAMQNLRKDDLTSREVLNGTIEALDFYVQTVGKAATIVENENPGKSEQG